MLGYYAYCVRQPCEASATGEGGGGPASYRITAACSQRLGEQRREADDRTRSASNPEQVRAAEARDSGLGSGAGHASLIESPPERKSPESVRLQVVAATTLKVRRGMLCHECHVEWQEWHSM